MQTTPENTTTTKTGTTGTTGTTYNAFQSQRVGPEITKAITDIHDRFGTLAQWVADTTPNSNERTEALNHLQTACMWATKSITHN